MNFRKIILDSKNNFRIFFNNIFNISYFIVFSKKEINNFSTLSIYDILLEVNQEDIYFYEEGNKLFNFKDIYRNNLIIEIKNKRIEIFNEYISLYKSKIIFDNIYFYILSNDNINENIFKIEEIKVVDNIFNSINSFTDFKNIFNLLDISNIKKEELDFSFLSDKEDKIFYELTKRLIQKNINLFLKNYENLFSLTKDKEEFILKNIKLFLQNNFYKSVKKSLENIFYFLIKNINYQFFSIKPSIYKNFIYRITTDLPKDFWLKIRDDFHPFSWKDEYIELKPLDFDNINIFNEILNIIPEFPLFYFFLKEFFEKENDNFFKSSDNTLIEYISSELKNNINFKTYNYVINSEKLNNYLENSFIDYEFNNSLFINFNKYFDKLNLILKDENNNLIFEKKDILYKSKNIILNNQIKRIKNENKILISNNYNYEILKDEDLKEFVISFGKNNFRSIKNNYFKGISKIFYFEDGLEKYKIYFYNKNQIFYLNENNIFFLNYFDSQIKKIDENLILLENNFCYYIYDLTQEAEKILKEDGTEIKILDFIKIDRYRYLLISDEFKIYYFDISSLTNSLKINNNEIFNLKNISSFNNSEIEILNNSSIKINNDNYRIIIFIKDIFKKGFYKCELDFNNNLMSLQNLEYLEFLKSYPSDIRNEFLIKNNILINLQKLSLENDFLRNLYNGINSNIDFSFPQPEIKDRNNLRLRYLFENYFILFNNKEIFIFNPDAQDFIFKKIRFEEIDGNSKIIDILFEKEENNEIFIFINIFNYQTETNHIYGLKFSDVLEQDILDSIKILDLSLKFEEFLALDEDLRTLVLENINNCEIILEEIDNLEKNILVNNNILDFKNYKLNLNNINFLKIYSNESNFFRLRLRLLDSIILTPKYLNLEINIMDSIKKYNFILE